MKIIADTHTHTVASEHAYSTLMENVQVAKSKGIKFLAITDHTGQMIGAPSQAYFTCMQAGIPDVYDGVYLLRGCEVNILDETGKLDLPQSVLERLEWVIASIHSIITPSMDEEKHTELWLNVAKNPHVDVIGHCGDSRYRFDYERVIKEFKKYGKIVEINASSYKARAGSGDNCVEIARLCTKYDVPLVLSSDAHFAGNVGELDDAICIVKKAGVPESLILNADYKRFSQKITQMTGRIFDD